MMAQTISKRPSNLVSTLSSLSTEKYGADVLRTCLNRAMALTAAVTLLLRKRCSVYL